MNRRMAGFCQVSFPRARLHLKKYNRRAAAHVIFPEIPPSATAGHHAAPSTAGPYCGHSFPGRGAVPLLNQTNNGHETLPEGKTGRRRISSQKQSKRDACAPGSLGKHAACPPPPQMHDGPPSHPPQDSTGRKSRKPPPLVFSETVSFILFSQLFLP